MRPQMLFLLFAIAVSYAGCEKGDSKKDAQIEANLDNRMNYLIQLYGSKEKLEKTAGKNYAEIRAEYRIVIAEQLAAEEAKSKISN